MALSGSLTKNVALGNALSRALALRRAHFPDLLTLSAPSFKHFETRELESSGAPRFAAVSITGGACALSCDHCRGALLESMTSATTPASLREKVAGLVERGCRGLLISGGCDKQGHLALEPFLDTIGALRAEHGLAIAVHTGLADGKLAEELARVGVDRVMLDLVGDPDTARSVLHLDAPPERFEKSLATLAAAGLSLAPHIVVGLHGGRLRGERRALEMLAKHLVEALVFVVIRPEPNTPFAHVAPPSAEEVAALFAEARAALPRTPLLLGCARPLGHHGHAIEGFAVRAGFNGIAFPSDITLRLARSLGLELELKEQCCALISLEASSSKLATE